jgi:serine protease Do
MSGGALLNRNGELIGITTSLAALDGYETSVGYAIPVSSMRRIIEDLLRGYEVEYGFLGIHPGPAQDVPVRFGSSARITRGIKVAQAVRDSPAWRAGLRRDDLVLAVNGAPVFEGTDIFREVGLLPPGASVGLRILKSDGRERRVSVTLGKWPRRHVDQIVSSKDRYPEWRGLMVDWPTARNRHVDFEMPYPRAVVVGRVEPGGPADAAGLREGDLITEVYGRNVETPKEFLEIVSSVSGPVQIKLLAGSREPLIRTIRPSR